MPTIRDLILTDRQNEVYQFLLDYCFRHGLPATFQDVALKLGCSVTRAAQIVEELVRKGWLVVKRFTRSGHTRVFHAPTVPIPRIQFDGTVILFGTIGGPVQFTIDAWRRWLTDRLAECDGLVSAEAPPTLRIVREDGEREDVA